MVSSYLGFFPIFDLENDVQVYGGTTGIPGQDGTIYLNLSQIDTRILSTSLSSVVSDVSSFTLDFINAIDRCVQSVSLDQYLEL